MQPHHVFIAPTGAPLIDFSRTHLPFAIRIRIRERLSVRNHRIDIGLNTKFINVPFQQLSKLLIQIASKIQLQ